MTNEELNAWERQPSVLNILTSKEFGEWLHRRDKNKEKRGEWVKRFEGTIAEGTFCNQCWRTTHKRTNFCPNCGADMREGVEDES